MASALPGSICLGQHSVCLVRAAKLDSTCTPVGGEDGGFISSGVITATATINLQEGQSFEPLNGCGEISWTYTEPDQIRSIDVSGELSFFDHEMFEVLFGGTVIVGSANSDFVGDNIGWAANNYTDTAPNPIYLELIVRTAGQGVGECASAANPFPAYVGYIFGRTRLIPGDRNFANEAATVAFTGTAEANPNLAEGPWGDWPGVGEIPNSPYIQISYSEAEFNTLAASAACGYQTLPAWSS